MEKYWRTLLILISSIDPDTEMEEFQNIEQAVFKLDFLDNIKSIDADLNNPLTKIIMLWNKIIAMKIIQFYDEKSTIELINSTNMDEFSTNMDEFIKNEKGLGEVLQIDDYGKITGIDLNLFEINSQGYIHLKSLSNYTNKEDYETSKKLLAGSSFEEIAPEGLFLISNINSYRNQMLTLIANHKGEDKYGNPVTYEIDTSFIEDPEFLESDIDYLNFELSIDEALQNMISYGKIDPRDKDILKSIYTGTTIPKYVMKQGKRYPWVFAQFENSIIGSSAILTSLRRDILQTQNLILTHLLSKIRVQSFAFKLFDG